MGGPYYSCVDGPTAEGIIPYYSKGGSPTGVAPHTESAYRANLLSRQPPYNSMGPLLF
jgi:hypothetical protein